MWREGMYGPYDGTFFSMPQRNILPKPYSKPHPPMWVACGSPPTFANAGAMGLGAFCFTTGDPRSLEPLIKAYKAAVANATPVGDYVNDNILCVTSGLCLEDREEAFDIATRINLHYYQSLVFHWLDNIPKPAGLPAWPEVIPSPSVDEVRAGADAGVLCIGDPDDNARMCQAYADIGCDQLVISPLTTTMTYETAVKSIELFRRELVPRFDKAVTRVVRRGLLDVARAGDVDRVEGPHAVGADDLEAGRELAKVNSGPGDLILLRTGQIQVLYGGDKNAYRHPSPGPGID